MVSSAPLRHLSVICCFMLSHAEQAEQWAHWHAVSEKLRATLVGMKKSAGDDAERPKVAWATMLKLVGNVVKVCPRTCLCYTVWCMQYDWHLGWPSSAFSKYFWKHLCTLPL
jgi:hypothetical protein